VTDDTPATKADIAALNDRLDDVIGMLLEQHTALRLLIINATEISFQNKIT
jgi:hypothetical protein